MSYRNTLSTQIENSTNLGHLDLSKHKDRQKFSLVLDQYSRILTVKLFNYFILNKDILDLNNEKTLEKSFTDDELVALTRNRHFIAKYVKELNYEGELFRSNEEILKN